MPRITPRSADYYSASFGSEQLDRARRNSKRAIELIVCRSQLSLGRQGGPQRSEYGVFDAINQKSVGCTRVADQHVRLIEYCGRSCAAFQLPSL